MEHGNEQTGSNWNQFHSVKNKAIKKIGDDTRASLSATVDPFAIPWLHNSSL